MHWFRGVVVGLCIGCVQADLEIVYPAKESPDDTRFDDLVEILGTALERTEADYGPYSMRPAETPMTSMRYSQQLREGRFPNLIWTSTSLQRERDLQPIRIPLRKGLLSYRISLIHEQQQASLREVSQLSDLKELTLVQGTGWGDIRIYEANGLDVVNSGYESLFRMINAGRVDLFPRGIGEVFDEWEQRRDRLPNLAIDEHLLLYYPWPYYFFVRKGNDALADRITTGLERMIDDGSFDAIFWRYNGDDIERADLDERHLIPLTNHFLPPQTPTDDPRLWFRPETASGKIDP